MHLILRKILLEFVTFVSLINSMVLSTIKVAIVGLTTGLEL